MVPKNIDKRVYFVVSVPRLKTNGRKKQKRKKKCSRKKFNVIKNKILILGRVGINVRSVA